MIILGVDPGLTRCGVGVIEAGAYRRLSFIHVDVVRSAPDVSQDLRLLAITGDGRAQKIQVERMVTRILNLSAMPTPADAADALALAICHALHPAGALQGGEREQHLTPAQRQWAQAAQKTRRRSSTDRGM